jgi:hypothetical protein
MIQIKVLEYPIRQSSLGKRRSEPFRRERRLVRRLENHDIASGKRGDDRVDGGQIRVVPRRQYEDNAMRLAANEPFEPVHRRRRDFGQGFRRDLDHMPCAFLAPRRALG